jgi:hypothetical protein
MKLTSFQSKTTSEINVLRHLLKTYSYCIKNGSLDSWLEINDNVCVYNIFNKLERELNKQEGQYDGERNQ